MTVTPTLATPEETLSAAALVRLHVTPLSPAIYSFAVPVSLQTTVAGVSYHEIPTFPERAYGYIDLPAADADKLQKRLHGALVKGVKVKVEPARPKAEFRASARSGAAEQQQQQRQQQQRQQQSSSRQPRRPLGQERPLFGVFLPDARRVQRGWTRPLTMKRDKKAASKAGDASKSKNKSKKSEYTGKEECLFKTKAKEDPKEAGKKRKRGDGTTIVHEFQHTTKYPTFLRGQGADKSKITAGYDPENGWIDTEGNVVEQPRRSKRLSQDTPAATVGSLLKSKSRTKNLSVTSATKKLSLKNREADEAPNPSTSDDADSSSGENEGLSANKRQSVQSLAKDDTSSSGSSDSDSGEEAAVGKRVGTAATGIVEDGKGETSRKLSQEDDEKQDEVHPLEAIFKKPKINSRKPPGLELKIPFSFFGNDEEDGDEEEGSSDHADRAGELPPIPQTPYTQADLRFRRQRSAAPTPDTAAPTKLLFSSALDRGPSQSDDPQNSGDEASGSADANDVSFQTSDAPKRSEFAETWFWEKRGDNNRAWKKRRREATKEQRHVANKKGSKR